MNKLLIRYTLFLLVSLSLPSIAAGQVEISAVSSASTPAVGDTIEVSINIARGSNIAGYDFTLTFDPTQLQYISIENAGLFPTRRVCNTTHRWKRFSAICCARSDGSS